MTDKVLEREEESILLSALHLVATESSEGDIVRIAMCALYETERGRAFLKVNPIKI